MRLTLAAAAIFLLPIPAACDETDAVIDRCLYQLGEFGTEMIEICVEQDRSAARALSQYPDETKEIVARCTRQMQPSGWSMVKACADHDIEAAAALAKYPKAHEAVVERCQTEVGAYGAALVKTCADQEILRRQAGEERGVER